jgi:hypothetical protein
MRRIRIGIAAGCTLVIAACGGEVTAAVAPCDEPVPLHGTRSPAAPGYVVVFQEGVDPHPTAWELAQRHGFSPDAVFALGFYADFPDATLQALRCEPVVRYIEHMVEPAAPPGAG